MCYIPSEFRPCTKNITAKPYFLIEYIQSVYGTPNQRRKNNPEQIILWILTHTTLSYQLGVCASYWKGLKLLQAHPSSPTHPYVLPPTHLLLAPQNEEPCKCELLYIS